MYWGKVGQSVTFTDKDVSSLLFLTLCLLLRTPSVPHFLTTLTLTIV